MVDRDGDDFLHLKTFHRLGMQLGKLNWQRFN